MGIKRIKVYRDCTSRPLAIIEDPTATPLRLPHQVPVGISNVVTLLDQIKEIQPIQIGLNINRTDLTGPSHQSGRLYRKSGPHGRGILANHPLTPVKQKVVLVTDQPACPRSSQSPIIAKVETEVTLGGPLNL